MREALELINTAQQAATMESREGAKKLAIQQQVNLFIFYIQIIFYFRHIMFTQILLEQSPIL